MTGNDWKDKLNPEQRRAVDHDGPPLIVLAGPGTGKTFVIIARIRRLIEEGVDPSSILALTFTVKAAQEMRDRLAQAVGARAAEHVNAATFHSFGRQLLSRFGDMIGFPASPTIMDSAQRKRLLRRLIYTHGLFSDSASEGVEGTIKQAGSYIESCRNAGKLPQDVFPVAEALERAFADQPGEAGEAGEVSRFELSRHRDFATLYQLFEQECAALGVATFDDFLIRPLQILRSKEICGSIIRTEIRHVVVDEFQDVNPVQIDLLRHVSPPDPSPGRSLMIVGDDDQSIYGFRGSSMMAFDVFARGWPGHQTVPLERNYRSVPEVVTLASAFIKATEGRFRPDKRLIPQTKQRGAVEGVLVGEDGELGTTIAACMLADRRQHPERAWREYAVLCRLVSTREQIAAALSLCGVPVQEEAQDSPADDEAVKDALAWARLLANPADGASAFRLLVRPPFECDPTELNDWRREYERAGGGTGTVLGFADWLARHREEERPVALFASLLRQLRVAAASEPADRVIELILRETALARTEPLSPEAAALRVRHLTALLRFVRNRQPFLEPPGDVGALIDYYDDLEAHEQQFHIDGAERLDSDAAADPDEAADGVRVITAHKAKGLEFDTVFVARVRPQWGFPMSDRSEESVLPPGLVSESADDHLSEERRLFYVACTRAKRRLVLLAKEKKSAKPDGDFFNELVHATPGISVPVQSGSTLVERAGLAAPDDLLQELDAGIPPMHRRDALFRREMASLRQAAFAALHDADAHAGADAEPIKALQARLSSLAATIRAVAAVRDTGALPDPLPEGADRARVETLIEAARRAAQQTGPQGLPAPLDLSFSKVKKYLDCPRCFYLQYVLKLSEAVSDELSIGQCLHSALKEFNTQRREAESVGTRAPALDELIRLSRRIHRDSWPRSRPYDEAGLRQIEAQAKRLVTEMEDDAQILEIERTINFGYACGGERHRFKAVLDRLDQLDDGGYRIVDFKTGKATKTLTEPKPDDLQMCIYAMAVAHFSSSSINSAGPDDEPAEFMGDDLPAPVSLDGLTGSAEYWVLATGQKGCISFAEMDLDKARRKIDQAITGMRAGHFARGKNCDGGCEWLGTL